MDWNAYLADWVAAGPELAGSLTVVLLMVGVAAALGFRNTAKIDNTALDRLATAEGTIIRAAVIAPDGRSAFAITSDDRVLVARATGLDVSARFAPAKLVRVSVRGGKLSAVFADVGYPPLHMKLEDSPAWLGELAGSH